MKAHARPAGAALAVALLALLVAACGSSEAGTSGLTVENPWARPAQASGEVQMSSAGQGMPGTGAVYLVIRNAGAQPDRLLGAETPIAAAVEIHETRMDGEVMSMIPLPEGLEIPAGGRVELKPGGYHVMLIGLQRDLAVGDVFELVLHFQHSGALAVRPEVRAP